MAIVTLTNFSVGLGGVIIITQFLVQIGKIDITIPWQIRTFIRILTLAIFLYLFCLEVIVFIPEAQATKIKIFQDGLSWSADIIKTLIGAIIGALAMNIAQDKDLDNIPDDLERMTTKNSTTTTVESSTQKDTNPQEESINVAKL